MSNLDPFTHVDLRGAAKARIVLADVIASVGSTIFIREGVVIYVEPPAEESEVSPESVAAIGQSSFKTTDALTTYPMTPPPQKPIQKHDLRKPLSLRDTILAIVSESSKALSMPAIYEKLGDDQRARWKHTTVRAEITLMLKNGVLERRPVPFGPNEYWARFGYVLAGPKN